MSEQQLINYLLWMKERGQTVLVPMHAPSSAEAVEIAPEIRVPEIEAVESAKETPVPFPPAAPLASQAAEAPSTTPPAPAPIAEVIRERAQYKVLFISLSPLSDAEQDMVSRIGAALKLEASEFAIAAAENAQKIFAESDAKAVVLMGEDAYPLVQARIHQTLLVISHPGAMLSEPQLKVTAWNALQKLKATL